MYKAAFQTGKLENSISFNDKNCILGISVGQLYHEAEKFKATINLINKSNLKHCTIVVGDSLQRHNMIKEGYCYKTSILLGDEWLERNQKFLKELTISHRIIRWDDCLNHPKYNDYKKIIELEYKTNPLYYDSVHKTIEDFMQRNCEDYLQGKRDVIYQNSVRYLLEESAAMICWALDGYDYIVYPKPITSALAILYDLFIEKNCPNKIQWMALRFRKK
jgi:hypothetical protein